jgi:uncharacterized membrane protein (DUF2068 family)
MMLALLGLAYTTVRLVETYGPWHGRAWAEWFAIITGGLYLPLEVYELLRRASWVKAGVLAVNVPIVVYLVRARRRVPASVGVPSD